MEHLFIVNPPRARAPRMPWPSISATGSKTPHSTGVSLKTWGPGHATILAREAVASQPDIHVYSVGGDGTLNEIVNGLALTEAPLGILPCGTGNDSIRSLTDVHDPVLLLEALIERAG